MPLRKGASSVRLSLCPFTLYCLVCRVFSPHHVAVTPYNFITSYESLLSYPWPCSCYEEPVPSDNYKYTSMSSTYIIRHHKWISFREALQYIAPSNCKFTLPTLQIQNMSYLLASVWYGTCNNYTFSQSWMARRQRLVAECHWILAICHWEMAIHKWKVGKQQSILAYSQAQVAGCRPELAVCQPFLAICQSFLCSHQPVSTGRFVAGFTSWHLHLIDWLIGERLFDWQLIDYQLDYLADFLLIDYFVYVYIVELLTNWLLCGWLISSLLFTLYIYANDYLQVD